MRKCSFKLSFNQIGQSTTEYILILAVVVMIAMRFKSVFQGELEKAINGVGASITSAISTTNSSN